MASASGSPYPLVLTSAVSDLPSAASATRNSPPSDDQPANADGDGDGDGAPATSSTPALKPSTPARTSSRDITDANEAASIHTTDGRVKNPVPSKLKGKADNKNGNFGVMHIDINSSQAALRNAAAKRTSEETEAAARLANMRGYQSIKRSRLAWNPQAESDPRAPASAPLTPQNAHSNNPNASFSPATRTLGPLPHETKIEQARLLTLLRSLHPVVVVDQLCKALAYFGGIPGAPPANDGLFPESARTNGQGSLFIGWIAEIFPPIDGNSGAIAPYPSLQNLPPPPPTNTTAATPTPTPASPSSLPPAPAPASGNTDTPTTPLKRPRGRPKGSKSSKARKDKGVSKSASNQAGSINTSNSASLSTSNPSQAEHRQGSQPGEPGGATEQPQANSSSYTEAAAHLDPDSSIMSTPGTVRKRGRPKGSKNRPKNSSEAGQGTPDVTRPPPPSSTIPNQTSLSPLIQESSSGPSTQAPSGRTMHTGAEQRQSSPTIRKDVPEQAMSMGAKQSPGGEPTTAPTTNHWTGSAMQPPESNMNAASHSLSRKRQAGEPVQSGDSESAILSTDASPRIQQHDRTFVQTAASEQTTHTKRRRVSREAHQNPGFNNVDSHSPRVGMATSPIMNNSFNGVSSGSFDGQISGNTRKGSNQNFQQHQSQQHNLQQGSQPQSQTQPSQNQQFTPHNVQQQASAMRLKPQHQQGHMPPLGTPRPRNQAPVYGAPQTSMGSQGYYAPRQMPGQLGQVGNTGGAFGRSGSSQNAQFSSNVARQGSGDSSVISMAQQGAVAGARSQHGQNASRQSSGFSNQQVPASSAPTSSLGQFQGFGEHSYLDMDYGLNDRDVQDAAAAFGDSSQLEAALAEPNIRERLYHAMNRR